MRHSEEPSCHIEIEAEGDRCLTLRLGSSLDVETSRRCLAMAAEIEKAGLPGVLDVIAAFTTVAVHYEPAKFGATPYRTLSELIREAIKSVTGNRPAATRIVKVPVCYEPEYGFDLDAVAQTCGLTPREVVELHTSDNVSVITLGFAPGHPYIGVHSEKLAIARRATPRGAVPGGSVAIANRQTVIYPDTTPGGWHVIGAMPFALFNPEKSPHTFLLPGDKVQFAPISAAEFKKLQRTAS